MNKAYSTDIDTLHDVTDGSTIMLGGFGLCGIPGNSIDALAKMGEGFNLYFQQCRGR